MEAYEIIIVILIIKINKTLIMKATILIKLYNKLN